MYDGANSVQELQGSNPTANILTGGIDEIFARTDSNGVVNFLADALGGTLALFGSSGTIQTQYTYDPFGNTSASGATSQNANEYTGRELDETGLYFYRARYYNPQVGRFLSEDPIGFAGGGTNLYAYVDNSPTNMTDPSGCSPFIMLSSMLSGRSEFFPINPAQWCIPKGGTFKVRHRPLIHRAV